MSSDHRPSVFIGSSVENLDIAYAVQENLEYVAEVTVWTQGVFELSRTALQSLLRVLDDFDFAVFVFKPDDVQRIRDQEVHVVRDNVIYELGLFTGRLGQDRTYFIVPRGAGDLHLPSDLAGISPATYDPNRKDQNLTAALGPACTRLKRSMLTLGLRGINPAAGDSRSHELVQISELPTPETRVAMRQSQRISLLGVSLFRFLPTFHTDIEEALKNGGTLRMLLVHPTGKAVSMLALRSPSSAEKVVQTRRIRDTINFVARWRNKIPAGVLEVRTIDYLPACSMTILEPFEGTERVFCHVKLFPFRAPSLTAPAIIPQQSRDEQLHRYFLEQFERMWEAATPFEFPPIKPKK